MSDRLAISATFSVLMMAIYVLFGAEAQRVPLSPTSHGPSPSAPAWPGDAGRVLASWR
ncbi:hypothetical protein [Novosphingobium album (ex Liu et al. 2023)]|uniref:Uncharacterized protein n=1 Tax=Novosphingobium album (ex Liu et al. 2023) TaxID=3031130 RepID=A0ABT5WJK6_9SPHN|nr:hypothetical protein [Novosphingobium album (ex Liu et al. 2023)]MDE8650223.1 hypothetical protein [Novosphingobium album (ex Liu et al. 2023)]